ncbi:MAG: type II toxin-antitoxin system HicB family antitoxin [Patescibacteria group bacterium]
MAKQSQSVLNYNAVFQEETAGGYSVWVPELPGCASQGETLDEAKNNIEEAIQLYLEDTPKEEILETLNINRQFFVPVSIPLNIAHG